MHNGSPASRYRPSLSSMFLLQHPAIQSGRQTEVRDFGLGVLEIRGGFIALMTGDLEFERTVFGDRLVELRLRAGATFRAAS